MSDFLLELRSEEIPARMQARARDDLARLFAAEIGKAGLRARAITTYATPRRIALIAHDLPLETAAVSEEVKGPRADAPPQAIEGFLRKTGLAKDQLVERDGVLFAVIARAGRPTADVLAEAIPAIVRAFPWPKSMRWGAASLSTEALRWVRPLQGIIALMDGLALNFEVAGIMSGRETRGHRFMAPGPISIDSAASYTAQLRAAHVIVDQDERAALIRAGAATLAAEAGLALIEDEALVAENAGLTEWPVPLIGRFDAGFLAVPSEVIQLTARVNQKYFVCSPLALVGGAGGGHACGETHPPAPSREREGEALANAFICVANIAASDGGAAIVAGNAKVLAARLADARFFYEQDLKLPLEAQAAKLDRIVFHEKLGTVADKVARVAKLARSLVESDIVVPAKAGTSGDGAGQVPLETPACAGVTKEELATLAERAARLCKADLVSAMVGEFPELQGVMGGYYAAAQGEHPAVAAAIRDHYKPVGQGDAVPTDPVTVAVSLADKLDTLISFFTIGEVPTGSKDPFALRRAALGSIALILTNRLRISLLPLLFALFQERVALFRQHFMGAAPAGVLSLFADRLKVQQREAGVRHDLIDAVFALGGEDDLVRLLARVHALQSFIATDDGANLLAAYKRAAKILKKEGVADVGWVTPLPYSPEPAEAALIAALDAAAPRAEAAVAAEDFTVAMVALASLRAPIDAFFEGVTVNDADPAKRFTRLALLVRFRDAVHRVADFSKIEG